MVDKFMNQIVIDAREHGEAVFFGTEEIPRNAANDVLIILSTEINAAVDAATEVGAIGAVPLFADELATSGSELRDVLPDVYIVILAELTEDGAIKEEYESMAQASRAVLAKPDFGPKRKRHETSFGQLSQRVDRGMAVANSIQSAIESLFKQHLSQAELIKQENGLIFTCAADIVPQPIDWLWSGWLAKKKLHIIGGPPGSSKTTAVIMFAATVSTGGYWPDGTRSEKGNVLIWSGEDGAEDTLVPRLIAAGADLNYIHFLNGVVGDSGVGSRVFDTSRDYPKVRQAAEIIGGLKLLILDPIVSSISGDSHKNAEVRRDLQPVNDFAEQASCAVIGITHFSKGTQGKDVAERITGSIAFTALPRVVMVISKRLNKDTGQEERVIVRAKSNIGPDRGGFTFQVLEVELPSVPGLFASKVEWGVFLDEDAKAILENAAPSQKVTALGETTSFVKQILADGPLRQQEVKEATEAKGLAWATVRRAKTVLGIVTQKKGYSNDGYWEWSLPGEGGTLVEPAEFPTDFDFDQTVAKPVSPDTCEEGPKMLTCS
jgi:putative DNA primase/helicase